MMNSKCCDDNNDYPTATYCGKCGKWLAPKGWTMLAGSPTRTFQIHDDINLTDLNLTTDDVHPDEKSFLLAFGDVVCFSENHECVATIIDDLTARFHIPSIRVQEEPLTPVFVRPYLCVVTTGQIAMWHPKERNAHIINDNRIVPSPYCALLGIDKPTRKAIICGCKDSVFILDVHLGKQGQERFNRRFISIEGLEENDFLKTPVLWEDDIVIFITAKGKLFQFNLCELPDKLTPKADVCELSKDAILSSPCLYGDSLFFESLLTSKGEHKLHQFNLRTATASIPALLPDDFAGGNIWWDEQQFQFSPQIDQINQRVIVSSQDLSGFVSTDINSWTPKFIPSNDGSNYRHWFSIPVNKYLLTVSSRNGSNRLRKLDTSSIFSNGIRVVWEASYDIPAMVAPPVWYNNTLFLLTTGQLSKWKWSF